MGSSNARTLAALFIAAGVGIGAVLGLIVGFVWEWWIHVHAAR